MNSRVNMLAHTKMHSIDSERLEARFVGSRHKIAELRKVAEDLGLREVGESLTIAEVFPEYGINPLGAALRGARSLMQRDYPVRRRI